MKLIGNALSNLKARIPAATPFSAVVPAETVDAVPLLTLEMVVLRSLAVLPAPVTLNRNPQIETWARSYPSEVRSRARHRITEAWADLERSGLIVETKVHGAFEAWFVTDRGRSLLQDGIVTSNDGLLPAQLINGTLARAVVPLYNDAKYDDACTAALKQLEILVRQLATLPDGLVGRELMATAFKPNEGPLADASAEVSEQVGLRDLMTGAMQYYRNPFSHRDIGIKEPEQAASIILLVNELMGTAYGEYLARQQRQQGPRAASEPPEIPLPEAPSSGD